MEKAIYKITNLINGKLYIGQSIRPNHRWWEHCNKAERHLDNYPIHNAIRKYGKDNFTFEILEWTAEYNLREYELIKEYNTLYPNGYNVLEGGQTPAMYGDANPRNSLSEEQIDNIIVALQENKLSDRQIAKMYGTSDKIVSDINHGRCHKRDVEYPIRIKKGLQKLTLNEVVQIKNLLAKGKMSYKDIADMFGVSKSNIEQINRGNSFYDSSISYPIRKGKSSVNQFDKEIM